MKDARLNAYSEQWSQLVASKSNRAVFIDSTIKFMDTYGFQGIDLDWGE